MYEFKVKPMGDRVVVKAKKLEEKTYSGIILPDSAKNGVIEGTVVSVSDGILTETGIIPMTLKVGDTVMYDKLSGVEIKVDGEDYLVLQEGHILGIIR